MDKWQWNDKQQQLINVWLTNKWGANKQCPMCGHVSWSAGPMPGLVVRGANDSGDMMAGGYPCVVVTCTNCGNTILVNAIVAGIRDLPAAEPPAQSEARHD